MQFSSKLATAVHILLYIEEYQDEEKITSEVLADTTGVNPVNIRKILALLKHAEIIRVKTGIGGTYLIKNPQEITLRTIFEAVEEKDNSLFRLHDHPNINCPVGRIIKDVLDVRIEYLKKDMLSDMEKISLSDMYKDMKILLGGKEK